MFFSQDMKDLVTLFNKYEVSYVLVGGFAVNYYGYVRTTLDIDFLLNPSIENARKIMTTLQDFGFGKAGIPQKYFEKPGSAIHLGVEPNRIDLLTHLIGISNDKIFSSFKKVLIDQIPVNIIAYPDLLKAKRNSNRLRDQADADELEKSRKKN